MLKEEQGTTLLQMIAARPVAALNEGYHFTKGYKTQE